MSDTKYPRVVSDWTPSDDVCSFERWRVVAGSVDTYSAECFQADAMRQPSWRWHNDDFMETRALCGRIDQLEQERVANRARIAELEKERDAKVDDSCLMKQVADEPEITNARLNSLAAVTAASQPSVRVCAQLARELVRYRAAPASPSPGMPSAEELAKVLFEKYRMRRKLSADYSLDETCVREAWRALAADILALFPPDAAATRDALDDLRKAWRLQSRMDIQTDSSRDWIRSVALSLHDAINAATGRLPSEGRKT